MGMKSLMLALTSARPASVAPMRMSSSGRPVNSEPATTARTSCPLALSWSAMADGNISSSSSRGGTGSPGQEFPLAPPGLLGALLCGIRRGDLRVDLIGVRGPVAGGHADHPHRHAGVLRDHREQLLL